MKAGQLKTREILVDAVSRFETLLKSKRPGKGVPVAREDQLCTPLEPLIANLAVILAFKGDDVATAGNRPAPRQ